MQQNKWHLAKIMGKIQSIAKKLARCESPEKAFILRIKREIYAQKKHIVFLEQIISKYENETRKTN